MTAQPLVRQFKFKDEILNDPDTTMHVNQVVEFFTDNGYPEMLNCMAKYEQETETTIEYSIGMKTSSLG